MRKQKVAAVCALVYVYVDGSKRILIDKSSGKASYDKAIVAAMEQSLADGTLKLDTPAQEQLHSEARLIDFKLQAPAGLFGSETRIIGCDDIDTLIKS